jgi:3-deoxy-manno-octulosonate cytidylyltransferase (CMP-KDO synthetase)
VTFKVIIPVRLDSRRLPGKALLDIGGKPMIQWVYQQACQSQASQTIIATDSTAIATAAKGFNAPVILTQQHHSGTDRLAEAVSQLALADTDVVVNVQGDLPLIPPALIDQVAANLLSHSQASMATLCEPIKDLASAGNPSRVKVVMDKAGYALYFSRAQIPYQQANQSSIAANYYHHIGLYAYRVGFLKQYQTWQPSPLEISEKLEQLRALWYGAKIHVDQAVTESPVGVDTPDDLQQVRQLVVNQMNGL